MDKTNAQEFRSNLKEWMDTAENEPVKITRKSGESFILLNSSQFEKMQLELTHLRGLAQGLSDSLNEKTKLMNEGSLKDIFSKAKSKTSTIKSSKKAV